MKMMNQKALEEEARLAAWRALTPTAQLADLDARLGVGVGAVRQRKMLAARIEQAQTPATEPKKTKKA